MGDACREFNTPVTGGNVSFYNESPEGAVYPTPTIGMLGLIEDITKVVTADFKSEGDTIMLLSTKPLGDTTSLSGSEYVRLQTGKVQGALGDLDIKAEHNLIKTIVAAADAGVLRSAHDISEGGIAVTLAESCFGQSTDRELGCKVDLDLSSKRDAVLFGEQSGAVVVSVKPGDEAKVESLAKSHGILCAKIGTVTGSELRINDVIAASVSQLKQAHSNALPAILDKELV
jgi:phosphoribosylformylglycinamidine synthase